MNELGLRLKKRRVELGLSKTELAKSAQCSVTMISKWESGAKIGLDYAARVSEKLNVSFTLRQVCAFFSKGLQTWNNSGSVPVQKWLRATFFKMF